MRPSAEPDDLSGAEARGLRVLRVAHHGVVEAWRERERRLRGLGVDLVLVSARRWDEGGRDVLLGDGDADFTHGVPTWGTHPSVFGFAPRLLWRLLDQPWDLIDLHEEPGALATAEVLLMRALRRASTPFVLYSAQNIPKRYPPPFSWIERYALHRAAGAYVCNVEAGEILRAKGLRLPATLIGLGVDLALFTAEDRSEPHRPLRVGYVGRLEPHKGVHVLIDALAASPHCVLEIAGDGPRRRELERQVDRLGLRERVTFAGHLGAGLPQFYRRLDVVVVPSLPTRRWLEQFCRVAVEAMASGVPVVASRTGAIPDVVADAGVLVEPGDTAAVASALRELADPQRWSALRQAGLQRCQQYSWSRVAEQHLDLYHDAVAGGAPGTAKELRAPGTRRVEVVVVAYGPPGPLGVTLGTLERRYPVTVVDNSSSAATADVVRRHGAHYVDAGANVGFAAGVNLALDSITRRGLDDADVLLLNPDATVTPEVVAGLADTLHAHPRRAAAAPAQVSPVSGLPERVSWPFPSPLTGWLTAVGLGRLDRRRGFLIGSVLLLRRSALEDVGRFDERFFLYSEETDWQRRATRRGWRLHYAPTLHATHLGAGTGGSAERRTTMFNVSLLAYMDKHHGRAGRQSFRAAMVAGSIVRAFLGPPGGRAAARWRLGFYLHPPDPATSRSGGLAADAPVGPRRP